MSRTKRPDGTRLSSRSGGWGSPLVYFVALCVVGLTIAPVAYIILGGFRSNSQITLDPAGLPNPWMVGTYGSVLANPTFWQAAWNSLVIATITAAATVALGLMVSNVLARYHFAGRTAMYMFFAAGLMFPLAVAITPIYIMVVKSPLATHPALAVIMTEIAFGLAQTVVILVPFLQAIPLEIEEAATVDGCSRLGFFARMVLPLSGPGIVTVGVLSFIGSWNNYILPLYMFSKQSQYTLPLAVQMFSSQYSQDTAQVLAFTSLGMLPAIVFFSIFQRRIVGGLTGAVKG